MKSLPRCVVPLLTFLFLTAGCQNFPSDPEGTLQQATNGTLLVGYSENPPWVIKGTAGPEGIEPDLVKAFARTINAEVQWRNDSEQNLLDELEKNNLHLVIAGITDDTPWAKKVSFTRPYFKTGKKHHVLGIIKGENAFVVAVEKFLHQQEATLKNHLTP
jgi:ABC-type amino acid transport substrate-binding protein